MKLICIECPNGCLLTAERRDGGIAVAGNRCKRGLAYAESELTDPRRVLCTTAATDEPDTPVLPVRTSAPIPKGLLFAAMAEINRLCVRAPVARGTVLIHDLLGTGADVIATGEIKRRHEP